MGILDTLGPPGVVNVASISSSLLFHPDIKPAHVSPALALIVTASLNDRENTTEGVDLYQFLQYQDPDLCELKEKELWLMTLFLNNTVINTVNIRPLPHQADRE